MSRNTRTHTPSSQPASKFLSDANQITTIAAAATRRHCCRRRRQNHHHQDAENIHSHQHTHTGVDRQTDRHRHRHRHTEEQTHRRVWASPLRLPTRTAERRQTCGLNAHSASSRSSVDNIVVVTTVAATSSASVSAAAKGATPTASLRIASAATARESSAGPGRTPLVPPKWPSREDPARTVQFLEDLRRRGWNGIVGLRARTTAERPTSRQCDKGRRRTTHARQDGVQSE
jgi:hypothetical protein